MKKISQFVTNHSLLITVCACFLLIPAFLGYLHTKVNYDILVYLPEDIETIQGENILTDDFGIGSFSFITIENMNNYDILKLEEEIRNIENVSQVISIADVTDAIIPQELIPDDIIDKIYHEDKTVILTTFSSSTSSESTIYAVEKLRDIVADATKVSGMTAMVLDTMNLSNQEVSSYVIIAVLLCSIVLLIATDSYLVPVFLLGNIGFAILYNLGSNIFLGEISYITQAITAVLQLGVTTDFSIFLYHKYEQAKQKKQDKKEAMEEAIQDTFKSVIGSSLTTIAGFLALCSMDLTLGADIGIVMAKGVLCGLICVLILFPALLLVFDRQIEKTKHKNFFPKLSSLQNFSIKHHIAILLIFLLLLIPAWYGNHNVEVYYKLDKSLPSDLASSIANSNLAKDFHIISPEIILIDKNLTSDEITHLTDELEKIDGIDLVLAPKSLLGATIPIEMLPDDLASIIENDEYQLIIINSTYEIASTELNDQVVLIDKVVKKYDANSIIAGEGPLMKDLTTIADHDFKMVNYTSIFIIFILMVIVLKSISLPFILISVIEFAIFTNMAISYYMGTTLPFIASIVIGTIQLGATIDYAILMSTKYLEVRKITKDKKEALKETLKTTVPSISVSALSFFAATFGVAIYSKIDMIGSICHLLSRGAIISMIVVIFVLPAFLLLFDSIIIKTTKIGKKESRMKKINKFVCFLLIGGILCTPITTFALTKKETIYTNLNSDGTIQKTSITNHLLTQQEEIIEDETELKDILNINGNETFTLNDRNLVWNALGKNIFYQGVTNKSLPIQIKIKYYLNDEEIDIKDLIGKKGNVKIVFTFENQIKNTVKINGKNEEIYTPFLVTVGTILNNKNNSLIEIDNGKVIDSGNNHIVLGIASPGLYDNLHLEELKTMDQLTLTYQTEHFSLNNVYIIATPKLIEDADLKIFDKLDTLRYSITSLQENMNLIEESAKKLESGTRIIVTGTDTLSTNLNAVLTAMEQLENGSVDLKNGLDQTIEAIRQAKNTFMNNNVDQSIARLRYLKEKNNQTIGVFLSKSGLSYETLQNIYLENQLENYNGTNEEMLAIKSSYELIYLLNSNNQAIDSTLTFFKSIYTQLNALLPSLEDAINQLDQGAETLSNGLSQTKLGIAKLYEGSQSLKSGIQTLSDGSSMLSNGITTFNQAGIGKLSSYSNTILNYSNKIEALINLSNQYSGFASNNVTHTTFIFKVNSAN